MNDGTITGEGIDQGVRLSERGALSLLWFALPAVALVIAVSHQSVWIDEALTGWVARQPTLQLWWHELILEKGSGLQMPLYMLYVWGCEKIFGSSELTLRLVGLPWLVAGVALFTVTFRRERERLVAALVVATSAFAWYYANEARPYAMQLGASCATVGALHRLTQRDLTARQESNWLAVFGVGLLTLCGSSMLGMIWAAAALAAAWVLLSPERLVAYWRKYPTPWALLGLALFLIGVFYLWTLTSGARASAAAGTDWQTMAFVFYEQLGFSGLGPGRTDMRDTGARALLPYAPALGAYVIALVAVMSAALLTILGSSMRRASVLLAFIAAPAVLLVLVAAVTHFRLLGRHWTPLMPIWFLLLTIGSISLWRRPRWLGKAVVAGFFALSLWSCLALRFAPRHARDDYRSAAQSAKEALARHETVWWNAAGVGAAFYDLPLTTRPEEKGKAILVVSPVSSSLSTLGNPDVIVASKPDLYDSSGAVAQYIARGRFRASASFAAFTVWRTGHDTLSMSREQATGVAAVVGTERGPAAAAKPQPVIRDGRSGAKAASGY